MKYVQVHPNSVRVRTCSSTLISERFRGSCAIMQPRGVRLSRHGILSSLYIHKIHTALWEPRNMYRSPPNLSPRSRSLPLIHTRLQLHRVVQYGPFARRAGVTHPMPGMARMTHFSTGLSLNALINLLLVCTFAFLMHLLHFIMFAYLHGHFPTIQTLSCRLPQLSWSSTSASHGVSR